MNGAGAGQSRFGASGFTPGRTWHGQDGEQSMHPSRDQCQGAPTSHHPRRTANPARTDGDRGDPGDHPAPKPSSTRANARVCNKQADPDPGAVQATPGTTVGIRPGQGPGCSNPYRGPNGTWQPPGFVAKRIESNSVTRLFAYAIYANCIEEQQLWRLDDNEAWDAALP